MDPELLMTAQIGFALLTLVYFSLFLREIFRGVIQTKWEESRIKKYKRLWISGLVAWAVLVSIFSLSGRMSDFSVFPFNFLPVIAIPMAAILFITFSKAMTEVLQQIPPENLIRLQSFRVIVEILLWLLFIGNFVPIQMTFEGRNFDILAGITAPFIAWLTFKGRLNRTVLIIWNLASVALLINIVTIAILSTPSPIRVFMEEPANTVVTYFPISWLPGFLVPLAYMLHFFSLKQLFSKDATAIPARG